MFRNRKAAGTELAQRLLRFEDADPVVLALPRGGVSVGFEIATVLRAPLDVVLVRKIGAPTQPELAVAAVVDGDEPETVVNEDVRALLAVSDDYLKQEGARQLAEIERRRQLYRRGRPSVSVEGRTALVVDDGIATGATVRAALRAVKRRRPRQLVLAVPVAAPEVVEMLQGEVDEIVCLATPAYLGAIGAFYFDFRQVSDAEVVELLDRAAQAARPQPFRSSD